MYSWSYFPIFISEFVAYNKFLEVETNKQFHKIIDSMLFLVIFVSMEKISGKLVLLLLFVSFWGCEKSPQKTGTLKDFVPEDASVILKISDWETFQNTIENSSLLSNFDKTTPYLFFSEEAPLLKYLDPGRQSLLCFNYLHDSISAYTFISKQTATLFQTDSIKNKTIETLKIDDQTIQRITIDDKIAYASVVDSVFVASSSQQLLMDILAGKTERGDSFKKVFDLPKSSDLTTLIRGNQIAITDSTNVDFPSWTALDISIAEKSFTANGIALATDTIPQLLHIFEGQVPQQNDLAAIVPLDAKSAMSFTYDDAENFQIALRKFRREKESAKTTGIFGSINEIGTIDLQNETAIFIKSIDASMTLDALARFVSSQTSFREIEIKSFGEPELFQKTFAPLIASKKANYVFQLDNFFIFTADEATAEELIASFLNNATLKNTAYYENVANDLGSASSLMFYKMQGNFPERFATFFNVKREKEFGNISVPNHPLAAIQYSYDRNFAHVTLSCREASAGRTQETTAKVSEKFSLQLENDVLGNPQLIDGNVVVQDIANTLYFISGEGKIQWTKNLGSPILGEIRTVNVTGKGQPQMVFSTKNALYVLDKTGKDVNSFPLKFKDEITHPVSVFDYDKNHNYRFMVVQGKTVLLYDKQGKSVRGFNFSKSKSDIAQSPAHIRIGKKDYIVIPEENGTLNILSRVGKSRVSVSKKFDFSEIPITLEDNTFVVITKENTKERISETGKISSQKLDVGSYWFTMKSNTKATLDDNLLRINGKLAELPLGLYSRPKLFDFRNKMYVTITETQENQVYVFDGNGRLLPGFPVYGTSEANLGISGKRIEVSVKGDPKGIIVYGF